MLIINHGGIPNHMVVSNSLAPALALDFLHNVCGAMRILDVV